MINRKLIYVVLAVFILATVLFSGCNKADGEKLDGLEEKELYDVSNEESVEASAVESFEEISSAEASFESLADESFADAFGEESSEAVKEVSDSEDNESYGGDASEFDYSSVIDNSYTIDDSSVAECDHDYISTTTSATCISAGKNEEKCSLCGDVKHSEVIEPLGHSYKTTQSDNSLISTCERCGDSKTQVIKEVKIDKSKSEGFYDGYGILKQADGSAFIYYSQRWDTYASHPYAGTNIGRAGCGPACMAMVISNFTDIIITPDIMGDWATAHGFAVKGRGSAYALFPTACQEYGIECTYLSYKEEDKIKQALRDGKLIMAIVGNGDFSKNRHFLLIRDITDDDKLLVADSNYDDNVLKEWDYDRVFGQLSEGTLWVFSK